MKYKTIQPVEAATRLSQRLRSLEETHLDHTASAPTPNAPGAQEAYDARTADLEAQIAATVAALDGLPKEAREQVSA